MGKLPGRSSVPLEKIANGQKPLPDPGAGQATFPDLHRGRVAARVHPTEFGADHPGQLVPPACERRLTAFRLRHSGKPPALRGPGPASGQAPEQFQVLHRRPAHRTAGDAQDGSVAGPVATGKTGAQAGPGIPVLAGRLPCGIDLQ